MIEAAPRLLEIVQTIAELRRMWRSQDEAETIDGIEYMDGLDAQKSMLPSPKQPWAEGTARWVD